MTNWPHVYLPSAFAGHTESNEFTTTSESFARDTHQCPSEQLGQTRGNVGYRAKS
jgi:hypothetical protein